MDSNEEAGTLALSRDVCVCVCVFVCLHEAKEMYNVF